MEKIKNNILSKISELYQSYGIKSVTMDDTARELGISKKTLYQHFSDKEKLVGSVVDFIMQERQKYFDEICSGELNAIETLVKVNEYIVKMKQNHNPSMFFDLKKYFPRIGEKFMKISWDRMHESILENLQKGQEEGIYRKEMNIEIIAKIHLSRVMSVFDNKVFTIEEISSGEFITEAFDYHIRGIANAKGIKILEELLKKNRNE